VDAALGTAVQPPDNPGVHVAEQQVASLGGHARAVHVVKNPLDLGAGKISRQRQTGLCAKPILAAFFSQLGANVGGAGVLPDDGVVDRLTGLAIPHDGCLALICNAHGSDVAEGNLAFGECTLDDLAGARPDLHGVVFDPTRLGVNLLVLLLVKAHHPPAVVKDHKAGAGRALVNRG